MKSWIMASKFWLKIIISAICKVMFSILYAYVIHIMYILLCILYRWASNLSIMYGIKLLNQYFNIWTKRIHSIICIKVRQLRTYELKFIENLIRNGSLEFKKNYLEIIHDDSALFVWIKNFFSTFNQKKKFKYDPWHKLHNGERASAATDVESTL